MPQSWVELLPPSLPQSKHDRVQKKLESVEKQLEEAQQLVQLREMKISGCGGGRDGPLKAVRALGIQPGLWGHREGGRGLSSPVSATLQPLATPECSVTLNCSSSGSWQ